MNADSFPDRPPRPGSLIPPATIGNVTYLLAQAKIRCRYNEIKKKVEIDIPAHVGTSDNLDNATMTAIVSLAAQHGMPVGHIGEYVNAIADRNAHNPVAEWIQSQAWDGIDRLPEVYATVIEHSDYPPALKTALLHKWLRSAAAAATKSNYKGRGVLTFQGPQGIGKTSWVKALVTDAALRDSVVKLDHHLDGGNKDSVIGAVSNWIVEIGELDSSFRKDIARLKGFLTADSDRVRRPYDRRESEYPRRTVFVATVNDPKFLVDPTGNNRWWTIAVNDLQFGHGIDMQQVFAQVAAEIADGAPWWLTNQEEAMLEAWNARHRVVSVIAEELPEYLDLELDAKHYTAVTASEMLKLMGYERVTNPQARECGAALRELFGDTIRIRGADKWRVPLKEPSAASYKQPFRKSKSVADNEVY